MARRLPKNYYELLGSGKIVYREENGKLHFRYREEEKTERSTRIYESEGEIPEHIAEKDVKAIKNFTKKIVKKEIHEQKKQIKKHLKYAANPNYPVSAKIKGIKLKGRIISALNPLIVQLDEPTSHKGQEYIHYGFAAAMAGHNIFNDKDSTFSKDAIRTAKELLIQIYEEKEYERKNKKSIDIVNKLNEK